MNLRRMGFGSLATAILLVVFAFMLGVLDPRSVGRQSGEADITTKLLTQQAEWNRGDVEAFLAKAYWHSPELTFSGSGGIVRGWDNVMARYKKNYPDRKAMGQLDFSLLEFRPLGPDAMLVLGHWHLAREKGDIGGVFSLVWQRFPEGWRIVHDHTSVVEQPK